MAVKSGVYCIRNKVNGKRYVGSAVNIASRFRLHKCQLRQGKHHSSYLQRSWDKHGEAAFEFFVLCRCLPEDCLELEQQCIDKYQSVNSKFGYNMSPTAGSSLGIKHSRESLARMTAAARKRAADPDWRAKTSEATRKKCADPEWRSRVTEANRRKATDPKWIARVIEANRKVVANPVWRANTAEASRRKAADPVWRAKHAEACRKKFATPDWKVKMIEAGRKRVADPVWRAKVAEANRKRERRRVEERFVRSCWKRSPERLEQELAKLRAEWARQDAEAKSNAGSS